MGGGDRVTVDHGRPASIAKCSRGLLEGGAGDPALGGAFEDHVDAIESQRQGAACILDEVARLLGLGTAGEVEVAIMLGDADACGMRAAVGPGYAEKAWDLWPERSSPEGLQSPIPGHQILVVELCKVDRLVGLTNAHVAPFVAGASSTL